MPNYALVYRYTGVFNIPGGTEEFFAKDDKELRKKVKLLVSTLTADGQRDLKKLVFTATLYKSVRQVSNF